MMLESNGWAHSRSVFAGNYAAGYVRKNLRVTSKSLGYHKAQRLGVIMDLPTDLVYEVGQITLYPNL